MQKQPFLVTIPIVGIIHLSTGIVYNLMCPRRYLSVYSVRWMGFYILMQLYIIFIFIKWLMHAVLQIYQI